MKSGHVGEKHQEIVGGSIVHDGLGDDPVVFFPLKQGGFDTAKDRLKQLRLD